jgi:hypothetical protein
MLSAFPSGVEIERLGLDEVISIVGDFLRP